MGQDILHVAVWKKGDQETIYDMIYRDGGGRFFRETVSGGRRHPG